MDDPILPLQLEVVGSMSPTPLSRAWISAPHPYLPILATCASDRTVRIYSLTSFTQLSSITGGHKRSIRTCAWKPNLQNESTLATGSFDSSVGVWRKDHDVTGGDGVGFTDANFEGENQEEEEDEEWRFALVLDGHDSEVKGVSWNAGGNLLATCSRDKSVWIWEEMDEDDYETVAVLQEHSGDVKCVSWHPEEEMLASCSYDDDVRLWKNDVDDWTCISLLQGHSSTVWMVEWEALSITESLMASTGETPERNAWIERRKTSGPRLASCSDDVTIRIWRRVPREKGPEQSKLSIIRTGSIEEDWLEEAQLPKRHDRAIYAISWSKKSGRIASTGGDGKIVVYEERWRKDPIAIGPGMKDETDALNGESQGGAPMDVTGYDKSALPQAANVTEWVVVAEFDGAHDVFEVNHIAWAKRADRGKHDESEEILISTGDDGGVKVWALTP
ncbi:MAG: hypothetical protein LQ340_003333 [Diploschistes diacapsis]|nr:MAG: hypothetical protein LQ340_003333 [Diploschistes diacapsis]